MFIFQPITAEISDASRGSSAAIGRAHRLQTLLYVVGEHGADTGAAFITAVLWLRAGWVRQAHALGTSFS